MAVNVPDTTRSMTTWKIDSAHSTAEFSVKHMMITTVKGRFNKIDGTIYFDEQNLARARVEATIDTNSIDTGASDRDNHLRSADFFEVEKYPTIAFKSTRVEPRGSDEFRLYGDLTIHGQTRQMELDTKFDGRGKDMQGIERVSFTATGSINRRDFGLNWNVALEAGGVLVSDKVKIELSLQAVRQSSSMSPGGDIRQENQEETRTSS